MYANKFAVYMKGTNSLGVTNYQRSFKKKKITWIAQYLLNKLYSSHKENSKFRSLYQRILLNSYGRNNINTLKKLKAKEYFSSHSMKLALLPWCQKQIKLL